MTKNIADVRRRTARLEKGAVRTRSSPSSSSKETSSGEKPPEEPEAKKLYHQHDDSHVWTPGISTAFKILVSLRMSAGIWSPISDCDETYNYWEPLHFLLYGSGFQTWEYSPVYAIRSYAYILIHTLPVRIFQTLLPHTKVTTFFYLRCFFGLLSSLAEVYLYRALCRRFGNAIGRIFIAFTTLSAGMFVASCAFLPSSFSMILTTLSLALWLERRHFLAILSLATSALVGWPFAAITGLPIVIDFLVDQKKILSFICYSLLSGGGICALLVLVDSHYYGKFVLAPLNIVAYNVLGGHGPNLYGTAPIDFYLVNLSLNFNVAWLLAISSLLVVPFVFWITHPEPDWSRFRPVLYIQLTLVIWLLIFFSQPHKEERFLFPIYPLICVCSALSLASIDVFVSQRASKKSFASFLTVGSAITGFALLSGSRSLALYRNYHAPFDAYMSLSERISNTSNRFRDIDPSTQDVDRSKPVPLNSIVCVGKEWYRYPGSFFLPDRLPEDQTVQVQFIRSEFRGLLPKPYSNAGLPAATREIPTDMNDMNREELSRYVPTSECDFIVDLESEDFTESEPIYSRLTEEWKIIHREPFLINSRSHRLFRAFYIPILSDRYCTMGKYVVLERQNHDRVK